MATGVRLDARGTDGLATDGEVDAPGDAAWTVDELARRAALPVRTIREYQTIGLLHRPRRSGRIGLYDAGHLRRLQLIGRLQRRGYSLAGIADLLGAWRDGADLVDVLDLDPDELVHVDEPGAPATRAQLAALLPALVPHRLDALVATGVVEDCGAGRYCVPSPSLLQLTVDTLAAGVPADAVLALLASLRDAADRVADAVLDALATIPTTVDDAALSPLVGRGRGLLAHGVGRLALHRLGTQAAVDTSAGTAAVARGLRRASRPIRDERPASRR